MKKLVFMMAVQMAMTANISAFAMATPKTDSVITSDKITVGDVFDGVETGAASYLAPAPASGKTVTYTAHDLSRISEAFHLGWTETAGAQVTIRMASSTIDRYDIEAALQEKIAAELHGDKFEMELADRSIHMTTPSETKPVLSIENLKYDMTKGEFTATAMADDVKKELRGRIFQINQIPVLKTALRSGDVISASDIDYIDMRSNIITNSMIIDAKKLIGQTPRRGVAALRPLTLTDVQLPIIVKKGDSVTMALKSNSISLTAQGKALDNGAVGDNIRVMNISSKQTIDATVTGEQTVTVRAPSTALSMNEY